MSKELKKSLEAWLETNYKYLFQGLRVFKLGIQLGKTSKMFRRKKNCVLIVQSAFLVIISPAFLALGLVQDGNQLDVRWSK